MLGIAHTPRTSMAYRLDGPSDAPVVMFANSLAADLHMWEENVPAFSQRYRVLRYDMRGHGRSEHALGDCTAKMLAADAVDLIDALDIERVDFVGLSLGGIVGQQLGAHHGSRLRSLTLCDTMSRQAAPAAWAERIVAVRRDGMQAVLDGTVERWFTPAFFLRRGQRVDEIRSMILKTQVEGYAGCAAAVRDLYQTDLLPQVRTPTLVLTGEFDPAAPPALAAAMHEAIAGSKLHVVANAAHLPNIEQPEDFNAAVLGFIDAVATEALRPAATRA